MLNNFESFDNSETSTRKSALIQERVNLVSVQMYKQFYDYQHALVNANEIFSKMVDNLYIIVDSIKEAFSSRNITTQNIYMETDSQKSVAIVNILWREMSFTTRCNYQPQALWRENGQHLFSTRIMAVGGNYNNMMKDITSHDEEMKILLDNEVASLFIPPETTQNSIMKIPHASNREFSLNQVDAPREFALKVIEIICGGGLLHYHEEGARKTFNI